MSQIPLHAPAWRSRFAALLSLLLITAAAEATLAADAPVELHNRIYSPPSRVANENRVALTLEACSGQFDEDLINFLVKNRLPATIFATKKWIDANPYGVAVLKKNLALFDIEDHGENHIPAVIGVGRKVYGIPGEPDVLHLRREVSEGAHAIEQAFGVAPHWYRGATAEYDAQAIDEIRAMHYKIAGFSVNADAGATLARSAIARRMQQVKGGDVIIAHMNKPAGDSAEGLAVGLADLQKRGFEFVRLDQVDLQAMVPAQPGASR